MKKLIRTVGYIQNISKGNESAASQMSHLIVGVFGGLPDYAVSLRVAVAFYISCILEVPSGVVADIIGHARSMVYGCICYSLACVFIIFAVLATNDFGSLLLVVFSSVLSAFGGALSSGSFQALIQDLIDKEAALMPAGERRNVKIRTLSLSQGHGAFIATFFPIIIMAALVFWGKYWEGAEFFLLIPAMTFMGFAFYFYRLGPATGVLVARNKLQKSWELYFSELNNLKVWFALGALNKRVYLYGFSFLMIVSTVLMIHVHTYLMVSQLREIDIRSAGVKDIFIMFLMMVSFDLAHMVKGWIVPFLTRRCSDVGCLILSYFGVITLAFLAWVGCFYNYQLLSLIIFVLFFRAFLTLGQNIVQSSLLVMLPRNSRATVLSVIQGVVILLYGTYSLWLTFVGIEDPSEVLLEVVVLGGCCMVGVLIIYYFCRGYSCDELTSESV